MSAKFMLDTNVFNKVLEKNIALQPLGQKTILVTHVQEDELRRTPNVARRQELLKVFQALPSDRLPTETALWNDSPWGETKWSPDDGLYSSMLQKLIELDKKYGKGKRDLNQSRDVRIAETAIRANAVLVTDDCALTDAARAFGCAVLDTETFLSSS